MYGMCMLCSSYLHDEPSVLRGNQNGFDPVLQFYQRSVLSLSHTLSLSFMLSEHMRTQVVCVES